MEWFALAIPFGFAFWMWKFRSRWVVWWELLLPIVVGIILIAVSRSFALMMQTRTHEFWTGYAVQSEYHEAWVERVEHSEDITDKDGKVIGTRHWTTNEPRPAEWNLTDNNDITLRVDREVYRDLRRRWNNQRSRAAFHFNEVGSSEIHTTTWDGLDETMEVVTTDHYYENRIPVSNSPLRYAEVPKADVKRFQLINYPRVRGYDCPMILGPSVPGKFLADRKLGVVNARLGHTREVKIWILLYKGQTQEAALKQRAYWQNANMNEFVLCIGVDSQNNTSWAYVFSWTKVEELKVAARKHVEDQVGQPLNLNEVVDWLGQNVNKDWKRRDFSEFNYLSVALPGWAYVLIYLLVIGASIGCSYWAVQNEYSEERSRDF